MLDAERRGIGTGNRGRTTFAQFADLWMADRREQILLRPDDPLSPSTVTRDEGRIRVHIIPALGRYRMEQISAREIESAKRTWRQTPLARGGRQGTLSPKSISNLYIVLRKMLHDAVRWKYIEYNPCQGCDPPPGGTRKVIATSLADAATLVAYPSLSPVHVGSLTELFTGLRRGELMALRREDLDLDQGTIWCDKAVARWDHAIVVKSVKTNNERGRRMQPLAPFLRNLLRAYVDANPTMSGPLFCACGQDERWSCPQGKPMSPDAFSDAQRRHMKKVGIVASSQTLRHAFNSLQATAGTSSALRAVLMGHSATAKMTDLNYLTVWMADKQAAAEAFEKLLVPPKPLPAFDWEEPPAFEK
jgi:integrase